MTVLLYNPLSKSRKSRRVVKRLVDRFKKHNVPFRVKSLLKIADLETYLKEAPKGVRIILIGGDGTINTFINNTMNIPFKTPIYLHKSGSGNDFLRSLKAYDPPHQHIMRLLTDTTERHFINGAGIGMDGEVCDRVNRSKKKRQINYLVHTVKTFFSYKPKTVEATIDGETFTFKRTYVANINNGAYIGGGMKITPKARLDEAALDVIIVHNVSKPILMLVLLTVYLGIHTAFKSFVFTAKAKDVSIRFPDAQIAQCDGETLLDTKTLTVSVSDKIVRFKRFKKAF